jgi:hypothetical protein
LTTNNNKQQQITTNETKKPKVESKPKAQDDIPMKIDSKEKKVKG